MNAVATVEPVAGANDFGEWLDRRMAQLAMRQSDLARESGVADSQLSRYREGKTLPSPATLRRLSEPLDTTYDKLMVIAGYVDADEKKAARTLVVETTDPKRHRLFRVVEGLKQSDLDQAERVLKAIFTDDE